MFVGGVIDGKGKFRTDISVPGIGQEFHAQSRRRMASRAIRVTLIGHDLQALCKVSVNTLNNHGVVVVT
jgi:hypothetical protein